MPKFLLEEIQHFQVANYIIVKLVYLNLYYHKLIDVQNPQLQFVATK